MTVIPQPFILGALAGSTWAALGFVESAAFDEVVFTYEPGNRFFIFTDGFYEIRRSYERRVEERFLDYDCFTELLREFGKVPFNRIIPMLEERFSLYNHDDDATLIVIEMEDNWAAGEVESLPGAKRAT